jgi:hypothetical protein
MTKTANLGGAIKSFVKAWPPQQAQTDVIRASGIYDLCPREFVLNYFAPMRSRGFDPKGHLMMGTGSYLHGVVQNVILGPMGILRGRWTRIVEKSGGRSLEIVEGYHPDPELAIHEMSDQLPQTWHYEEYTLWDETYRIRGHIDGIVSLDRCNWLEANGKLFESDPKKAFKELSAIPPGDEAKMEIKTCGSWVFSKMNTPNDINESYRMQSNVYQKMSGMRRVMFWFINRDSMDSKIIPYWYEPAIWQTAANKCQLIWESIRNLKLPDSFKPCKLQTDARAKACPFVGNCFKKWNPGEFESWARTCIAGQPDRKWLDLTKMTFPVGS